MTRIKPEDFGDKQDKPERMPYGSNKLDRTPEKQQADMIRRQQRQRTRRLREFKARRAIILAERQATLAKMHPADWPKKKAEWAAEDAKEQARFKPTKAVRTLLNHQCATCNRPFSSYWNPGPNRICRCPSCAREARLQTKRATWAKYKDKYNADKIDKGTYGALWTPQPKVTQPKAMQPKVVVEPTQRPIDQRPIDKPSRQVPLRDAPPPPRPQPGQPVVVWQPKTTNK